MFINTLFLYIFFVLIFNGIYTHTGNFAKKTKLRILEGTDVTGVLTDEYSFVIILSASYSFRVHRLCTGFMITETWGLTAGHCECSLCFAWYGNFTESPVRTQLYSLVDKMIKHPSYRVFTTEGGRMDLIVDNDLCLFHVNQKIDIKSYASLLSVDRATIIGLPVTYVGSGYSSIKPSPENDNPYKPLKYGEGTVISCDTEMRSKSKYSICIAPKCSKRLSRPWYGDSGGPLIHDGKIIGICSYGIESDNIARAAYTPISPYIDWIYDVMLSIK